MPRGDGTGPQGFGRRTGRAAGYCAGFPVPGYMNPQPGFRGAGFGRGRGWGRGWGRGLGRGRMYGAAYPCPVFQGVPAYGTPYPGYGPAYETEATTEQEVSFLKEQAALLKEELEAVQGRLEELGKQETGNTDKDK